MVAMAGGGDDVLEGAAAMDGPDTFQFTLGDGFDTILHLSVSDDILDFVGAGLGAGLTDDQYLAAGARIANDAAEIFSASELTASLSAPISPSLDFNAAIPSMASDSSVCSVSPSL